VRLQLRRPRASKRRNAKYLHVPKSTEWRTLQAQGVKEMVEGMSTATGDVLLDCILYAADRVRYSERNVQQTTSAVHSRAERCAADDGGIFENLLLRSIS